MTSPVFRFRRTRRRMSERREVEEPKNLENLSSALQRRKAEPDGFGFVIPCPKTRVSDTSPPSARMAWRPEPTTVPGISTHETKGRSGVNLIWIMCGRVPPP